MVTKDRPKKNSIPSPNCLVTLVHLHVLHCFGIYLPATENWAYRLIKNETGTQRSIASSQFLEDSFLLADVEFLRSPLQPVLMRSVPLIAWRRWQRAISILTYPVYLYLALRHRRVDVVHSHFASVGWKYSALARRLGAKHVVSFYGWDYARLSRLNSSWANRLQRLYDRAEMFLCEGPHGAATLAANGCPQYKIRIAKLGVEPGTIPVHVRRKRAGQLRLVQIASFREKKGHIDTVQAFADAREHCPNMHLTLIGASPGEVCDAITQLIRTRHIEDKVTLLPGVSFGALYDTLRHYDVFIHPSRHARDGDCEGGAPIVLLDAQATGMPVIATTHCDIPQEVIDGVTGLLCPECDVAALTRAIIKFYEMGDSRYEMFARAARLHVEEQFNAIGCARHVETLYAELIHPTEVR